jgi:hypothetical protein
MIKDRPLENSISDLNPHNWAKESFKISENLVYEDISESLPLKESYIEKSIPKAEQ